MHESKILSLVKSKGLIKLAGWTLFSLLLTSPANLFGQMMSPLVVEENSKLSISASSAYQFKSGLSGGGDVSVSRYALAFGGATPISDKVELGARMSYEIEDYNFSNPNGLSLQNPWNNINRLGLGMRLAYKMTDQWSLSGGPIAQYAGENGANFTDSLLYGGIVSAMYKANRDLTIGFGAGVFSRLEETRVFPSLLISWRITDRLHLGNSYRLGPGGPAGLELSYILDENWQVAAGGGASFLKIPTGQEWPHSRRHRRKF